MEKPKFDKIIVFYGIIMSFFAIIGIIIGYYIGNEVQTSEFKLCIEKFEECRTRFNTECIGHPQAQIQMQLDMNLTKYLNSTKGWLR